MIYLLLGAVSAFFGAGDGLGATTLLRPLLDAVSPLPPSSVAALATMATLCAALVSAFFALGRPIPLPQEELVLLAVGALLGGVLGDLAQARFFAALAPERARLMQNSLLFTLIALPSLYFSQLARTVQPLALSRAFSFPVGLLAGLMASFLAFGGEPLTLMLYFLLFDADDDEAAFAALSVTVCAMSGKLITLLIRQWFTLPAADTLLWLLPGVLGGALLAMLPGFARSAQRGGEMLLRLSLFTAVLNVAAAMV